MNPSHVGDGASHPGTIVSTNQDGTVLMGGSAVCVAGALFHCNLTGHGTTPITPVTTKTKVNGKLVVTSGAVAGCGAVISSPFRKVDIE